MRILILLVIPLFLYASEAQKCVDDYNAAVVERNNGTGSYKNAQNYKKQADVKGLTWSKRKRLLQQSQEATESAIQMLEKAGILLRDISRKCPSTIIEKVDTLLNKNLVDLNTYNEFNHDLKVALKLPK